MGSFAFRGTTKDSPRGLRLATPEEEDEAITITVGKAKAAESQPLLQHQQSKMGDAGSPV